MNRLFKILSNKKQVKEETVTESAQEDFNPEKIHPTLIIPEDEQYREDEVYILKYKHKKLPALKENQLQLQAYSAERLDENQVQIRAFIRHGVNAEIQLEDASIVLRDENEVPIMKKKFILHDLGALPPCSSILYRFIFELEDMDKERLANVEKWSVAFEIQTPHQLVYDKSWETALTDEQNQFFQNIFEQSPAVIENELNFLLINGEKDDKGIRITVFIRNGKKQDLEISELPLNLFNEKDELIVSGTFQMEKFVIPANSTKPWIFLFPSHTIQLDEPLGKIKLGAPQ